MADMVIERDVIFYRTAKYEGNPGMSDFSAESLCKQIGGMSFDFGGRYMVAENGHTYCVWPDSGEGHVHMRFGVIRHAGLPYVERAGNIHPLELLDEEGLVELTHVAFMPDGILAVERNPYGPPLGRLSQYFLNKIPNASPVSFHMLLNNDAAEHIRHLRGIRLVTLRIHRDHVGLVEQANEGLGAAFRAAAESVAAPMVTVSLQSELRTRRFLPQRVKDVLLSLVGVPGMLQVADVLKVRGEDERTNEVEMIDLLKDKLVTSRQMVRSNGRYRVLDSQSVYKQLHAAYAEMREAISVASGVVIEG